MALMGGAVAGDQEELHVRRRGRGELYVRGMLPSSGLNGSCSLIYRQFDATSSLNTQS